MANPEPSDYGSVAAIWFQGVGIVSPPLPAGEHVIHLYEPFSIGVSLLRSKGCKPIELKEKAILERKRHNSKITAVGAEIVS